MLHLLGIVDNLLHVWNRREIDIALDPAAIYLPDITVCLATERWQISAILGAAESVTYPDGASLGLEA